jgi:hypothetical protein
MAPRIAALIASALVCADVAAHAAGEQSPVPLRLTVDAPAGCPDRDAFLAQLHARSGRIREAVSGESAPSMHVELWSGNGQALGMLTVRALDGEEGHREVRGADCESVAAGLALVAAVILDPSAALTAGVGAAPSPAPPEQGQPRTVVASTSPGPAQTALAASLSVQPSPSPRDVSRRARPADPPRLSLGAAFEIAAGLGPDPGIVPRAFLDLELPTPLHGASARLSVGRSYTRAVATAIGTAEITLTDIRFEPCLDAWSPATLRVRACGIVEGGVLSGQGTNTTDPRSEDRTFLELGLGLRPTWIVRDQMTVGLLVGGAVPLSRYRFYFAPDATAYRLAPWSGFGEVSVGVRFW